MSAPAVVLARISIDAWRHRSYVDPEYREAVLGWLRANGVDPNVVTLHRDVTVELLDAPAIVREEYLQSEEGNKFLVPGTLDAAVHVVHSLCRVPLPDRLADPP